MSKLVRMLQQAHAIEIGAYHAYEGHWNSISVHNPARLVIWTIQVDEINHRESVAKMLKSLGAKPSRLMNAALWCIGKSIGLGCRIMPYRMAMWGAEIMEILGAGIYYRIAEEAINQDRLYMGALLWKMAEQEDRHKEILKGFKK